jgi:4'-phosphopantetheinyl transferase EntD
MAERGIVESAGAKRRAEFSTGRACAHEALRRLGVPDAPLLMLESRAPAWPAGRVGSISHTKGCCAAVVGRSPPWLAIGLDVERDVALVPGLEARVCTPAERAWLVERPAAERGDWAKVFFSAKEAVYKCQHPVAGLRLGFQDVEVQLRGGEFSAVLADAWQLPSGCGIPRSLRGSFGRVEGFVVAGVAVPAASMRKDPL